MKCGFLEEEDVRKLSTYTFIKMMKHAKRSKEYHQMVVSDIC
jgi:hypothetical protein